MQKFETFYHVVMKNPKPKPEDYKRGIPAQWKAERQKEASFFLPSVHASFYDTGLLTMQIFNTAGGSRRIQITNTRRLYDTGHLQKFLNILQDVLETSSVDFTNFRNSTVEYNDPISGEMFRAVVDAPNLSAHAKFAAIWSTLAVAPNLRAEDVLKVAETQKHPVTETGFFHIGYLKEFLLPYYNPVPHENKRLQHLKIDQDNFYDLLLITAFLHSDSEKTLREFEEEVKENIFNAALGSSEEEASKAGTIYVEWGSRDLQELDRELMLRIAEIPIYNSSRQLRHLILERIKAGATMAIEAHPKLTSYLASFLTVEEYEDFFSQADSNPRVKGIPEEFNALALEVIVRYYLIGGFSKVIELLDLIDTAPAVSKSYSSSFFYTRTVFDMVHPVRQKLRVEHFMKLLEEEYLEMPIGWALPLVITALEVEKELKIEELVASGQIPMAA